MDQPNATGPRLVIELKEDKPVLHPCYHQTTPTPHWYAAATVGDEIITHFVRHGCRVQELRLDWVGLDPNTANFDWRLTLKDGPVVQGQAQNLSIKQTSGLSLDEAQRVIRQVLKQIAEALTAQQTTHHQACTQAIAAARARG